MCPGCPVVDAVYLDVLVAWLPGRFDHLFCVGSYECFPSQTGPSPDISQVIILLFWPPNAGKISIQNALRKYLTAETNRETFAPKRKTRWVG